MCPELRNKEALHAVIKHFHARSLGLYELLEEEDDFQELLSPPPVMAATKYQLNLSYPDFSLHRVQVCRRLPPGLILPGYLCLIRVACPIELSTNLREVSFTALLDKQLR